MTRPKIAGVALSLAVLGSALCATSPACAQFFPPNQSGTAPAENIEGFTVIGKGSVSAKPNLVEIDVEVSAASEVSADAIVKYRDAKRRLQEAVAALKLGDITVEERGLSVEKKGMMNPYYFGGMPQNNRAKSEVQLSRKLVIRAANIRKLDEDAVLRLVAKLLDVAQDAGGQIGPRVDFNPYYFDPYNRMGGGTLVRFVLDDFDKLQDEAFDHAINDARTRAQRLARLSKVELGPIIAAREVMTPGDRFTPPGVDDETARKRLEAAKFQEIPVRVELLVRFEILNESKAKAKTP
jgi:uncharacterized protein YggE